jgi:hypothetical protein
MKKSVASGLGCLALCVVGFIGLCIAMLSATMVRSSYEVDRVSSSIEVAPVMAVEPPPPTFPPLATPMPLTTPTPSPEAGDDDSALEALGIPNPAEQPEPTPKKEVIEIGKVQVAVEDLGKKLKVVENNLDETLDIQQQILIKLGYTDEQIQEMDEIFEDSQRKGKKIDLEQVQEQLQH